MKSSLMLPKNLFMGPTCTANIGSSTICFGVKISNWNPGFPAGSARVNRGSVGIRKTVADGPTPRWRTSGMTGASAVIFMSANGGFRAGTAARRGPGDGRVRGRVRRWYSTD